MEAEILAGFARWQSNRGLLPSTIEKRRRALMLLAKECNPLTAAAEEIEDFLDRRELGARARYAYVSHFHAFYKWATRRGLCASDPTLLVDRPKLRPNLPRPVADADLEVSLSLAPQPVKTWLILAGFAGLRCMEIANLDRDGVLETLDEPMLRVLGKGQRERLIPMHPLVWESLRSYGLPRSGPVFVSEHTGSPYRPARVSQLINRYLHDVGIDSTAHAFRHWFGTKTYQECRDLRVVQELLGHSSPSTTAIYTAFSRPQARTAVMALHRPAQRTTT